MGTIHWLKMTSKVIKQPFIVAERLKAAVGLYTANLNLSLRKVDVLENYLAFQFVCHDWQLLKNASAPRN